MDSHDVRVSVNTFPTSKTYWESSNLRSSIDTGRIPETHIHITSAPHLCQPPPHTDTHTIYAGFANKLCPVATPRFWCVSIFLSLASQVICLRVGTNLAWSEPSTCFPPGCWSLLRVPLQNGLIVDPTSQHEEAGMEPFADIFWDFPVVCIQNVTDVTHLAATCQVWSLNA